MALTEIMDLSELPTADEVAPYLITPMMIYFFVLAIILKIKYNLFLEEVRKKDPDFEEDLGGFTTGGWAGGTYYLRTPLPIAYKSKDERIQRRIDSHDKIIKLFWISIVILLPSILLILKFLEE